MILLWIQNSLFSISFSPGSDSRGPRDEGGKGEMKSDEPFSRSCEKVSRRKEQEGAVHENDLQRLSTAMITDNYEYDKILVIGSQKVGKTSIFSRSLNNHFGEVSRRMDVWMSARHMMTCEDRTTDYSR